MSQQTHTKRDHEVHHKQQSTQTLLPSNTPRRILMALFLISGCISAIFYYFGDVRDLVFHTATVLADLQQALVTLVLSLWGSAVTVSAPFGFPTSGNGLWYSEPAVNWSMQYLPIGNGYLGAMINGDPISDRIQLNIESLWSGGPFADPTYNGGNHQPSEQSYLASELARIRNTIFTSSNGTIPGVEPLSVYPGAYGSYSGAGYLNINRTASGNLTNYARWLDMDHAVLKTVWTEPCGSFNRTYFCSNPTRACTVHTVSSTPGGFTANFSFSSLLGLPTPNITCLDTSTIWLRGYVGSPGMLYEILGTIQQTGPSNSTGRCILDANSGHAVLVVNGSTEAWVSWVGGTEYSMETGNAASGYTFKGADPHIGLIALLMKATAQNMVTSLATHIADYRSALGGFSLNIGQKFGNTKNTAELRKEYKTDTGNPYLEWLLFNYGRYLLVGSTRSYLPANLQGVWARDNSTPWSGDANINTQMNYWVAEMTDMKVTSSLWEYMAKTWSPRGSETAKILYNTTRGWVTHNEMNIFGHTGMKTFEGWNTATWANYPESAAWMMIHVYDHFDYTNDVAWWRAQGWPLLKGVAQFWLDHLIKDRYFNDSTLVTAPCNSPEQSITTFGCSHSQQLIWQLFEAVEKGFSASGDNDTRFLREVKAKKSKLDKGIRVGSWGQLQEWKLDFDRETDTHRHLSHLIGLYPGYTLTNFKAHNGRNQDPNLTRKQVLKASEISLRARGNGTGPDADAGWEKVWRAACWAQLQNSSEFYHILTYAIERNFAENLLSLYYPFINDPIFQIDANLGYPAAVLNALVQAPDTSSLSDPLDITLLPALPHSWASGSILGSRIRGGMTLDLTWSNGKPVWASLRVDPVIRYARQIQLWYDGKHVTTFVAASGLTREFFF
ncbi:glycoside hydrolase family 95 protein [Rhizoctonia solani 123E]|uniref:Glycoside hydrolase family 95 protein n=1 Tax=Rhizoctonia solani 123E TaxID=1423351 RepID=A0A074S0J7_9AGAM|nr:glycoside hydrolase family 95 protein [Rhizoctonia solani 123E]